MSAQPVLFTVAFRRKMAELRLDQRREWLVSLAHRLAKADEHQAALLAPELREVARGCRLALVDAVAKQLGPFDPRHLDALLEVPRERFVQPVDIERSADDIPLPLDASGLATISAPHAYLLSYRLLGLAPGDCLVELGTGSGYGAALAAFIVGPEGRVLTFEIDPDSSRPWGGSHFAAIRTWRSSWRMRSRAPRAGEVPRRLPSRSRSRVFPPRGLRLYRIGASWWHRSGHPTVISDSRSSRRGGAESSRRITGLVRYVKNRSPR